MPNARALVILSICIGAGGLAGCEREQTRSGTAVATDRLMETAMEEGRRTLPQFLHAYRSPKPGWGSFQVRHAYTTQSGFVDNIWLDLRGFGDNGHLLCVVPDDQDERITEFARGQAVTVEPSTVNDWLFIDQHGTFVGGYTMRVTMDRIGDTSDDREDNMHGGIRFRNLEDVNRPDPDEPETP